MNVLPTLTEAKKLIFDSSPGSPPTWEIGVACGVLAKACESPEEISFDEMLHCLDYPGLIAEHGARFLYVRTGRESLGWRPAGANGLPFRIEKKDWLEYLKAKGFYEPAPQNA